MDIAREDAASANAESYQNGNFRFKITITTKAASNPLQA